MRGLGTRRLICVDRLSAAGEHMKRPACVAARRGSRGSRGSRGCSTGSSVTQRPATARDAVAGLRRGSLEENRQPPRVALRSADGLEQCGHRCDLLGLPVDNGLSQGLRRGELALGQLGLGHGDGAFVMLDHHLQPHPVERSTG